MPSTEEGKRRIQQKLSQQRSLGGNQKQEDFFSHRKEIFLNKMADMGMDLMEVKDFVEERGIVEENPELIIDHLQNPQYINPLKMNFVQAPNPHAHLAAAGYHYAPDPRLAGQAAAANRNMVQAPQAHGGLLPPINNNPQLIGGRSGYNP